MELIELTRAQVIALYPSMIETFPPDELKPLPRILAAIDKGKYQCIGLADEAQVLGYAYFVKTGRHLLFDYLAVLPEHRNHGLGAAFLHMLSNRLTEAESTLLEVEDPAFTDDPMAVRRLQFYLRNGYRDTQVQVLVFGVHYLLLTPNDGRPLTPETVKALYRGHYRAMLPASMYQQNIFV